MLGFALFTLRYGYSPPEPPLSAERGGGRNSYFILDFYCHAKKLAVEIDGGIHDDRREQDERRTAILEAAGIRVIRFRNEEFEDMEKVRGKLAERLMDN